MAILESSFSFRPSPDLRITRRLVLGGLGLAVSGCGRGGELDALIAGEREKVATVVSGEVVRLESGLEVRLAGIEAPNGAEPWAAEAKAALEALVGGQAVSLFYGGAKRDRYERALAHVRLDKGRVWSNGLMLQQGLARVRTYSDNRALAGDMLEREAEARREEKGLWSQPGFGVLLPSECAGRGGFQIIEGRAGEPEAQGSDVAIALDGGAVRAVIPAFAADDFEAAGRAPASLSGKLIRVRGTLQSGRVRLDHPETVEILREA